MLAPSLFENTHPFLSRNAEWAASRAVDGQDPHARRQRRRAILQALISLAALLAAAAAAIGSLR